MSHSITHPDAGTARGPILDLWRRNLPLATPERYAWLYEHGPGASCLAQTESAQSIGAAGLMTRQLRIGPVFGAAGQAIDMNVDRDHRTMGLALQLQRTVVETAAERGGAFVYAVPNPQALPILRRVGYREVGPIDHWAKPLSAEYKLRRVIKPRLPAKALAFLIDPWLRWRYRERGPRSSLAQPAVALTDFDERFDELWHAAAPQFGIIGERNAAYLTWRFRQYPGIDYRCFGLLNVNGALDGYIVYRQDATGVVSVSDFLFRDQETCSSVFAMFFRHMRREGGQVVHLSFLGAAWIAATLEALGFRRRTTQDALVVYQSGSSAAAGPDPQDPNTWFFTRADMDVEG